jgi:hypothetical protein
VSPQSRELNRPHRRKNRKDRYSAGRLISSTGRCWLQSVGGSLRLPLLQNGACPFPGTPLLSVLMFITHTPREVVSTLPRFRIVAVSMKRLQVAIARIASITIHMIDLDPVIIVEAQLTVSTAPVLLFEELGQS